MKLRFGLILYFLLGIGALGNSQPKKPAASKVENGPDAIPVTVTASRKKPKAPPPPPVKLQPPTGKQHTGKMPPPPPPPAKPGAAKRGMPQPASPLHPNEKA